MKTVDIVRQAAVAAVYAVICLALMPVSYGPVMQFRFAEMLMILPFINKKYTVGLTLGCLIANIIGPNGLPDIILGTLATFLACLVVSRIKTKHLIAPVVAIINGLIVGFMLFMFVEFDEPLAFWFISLNVFVGEFVVVGLGTVLLVVIEKNKYLCKVFK